MRADIRDPIARLRRLPERSPLIGHAGRAVDRYRLQRGNHLSAAVAFYTVIAAVPLAMVLFVAVGVLVFWRATSPEDLVVAVEMAFPPGLMAAIEPVLAAAAEQRGSLVGIGALGALWAGTTWTSYLREALSAQFRLPAVRQPSRQRGRDAAGPVGAQPPKAATNCSADVARYTMLVRCTSSSGALGASV
ncbi:YhjD/YihY/BrkB family envelope integrity protein [Pseudonocardia sp. NPDC046786]|uniref:YihY/virulence factor BrkB family protein n=1 Tax=Pseudonocardia sp. NPDC046786 TaxID=3155471 RepID=UPI0033CB310F